jgi:hypothetical protein
MQIPLKQFEQYVDDIILQRGLSYFKAGCVTQFDEITKGEFEVIVEGTEVHKMLNIAGKHIENENYQSAVFICLAILEEMIEILNYTDDKPGLALEWYDWLLRIALIQEDTANIIGYARFLFEDGFRHGQVVVQC